MRQIKVFENYQIANKNKNIGLNKLRFFNFTFNIRKIKIISEKCQMTAKLSTQFS